MAVPVPLSGAAGDPLVLVPDLAGAARRLVPGSRLIDAPPARLRLDDVLPLAGDYELAVMHTSTPSFASDVKVAEALKDANPRLKIGLVGAKVAVEPETSLAGSRAIDFVAREEFDFTCREVAEGRAFAEIDGLSYRDAAGAASCTIGRARCSRTWTSCRSSPRSTSATSGSRIISSAI